MRIGELATKTGFSRDTIRFYEREGLIESAQSTAPTNDYRDYSEHTVERLAMIAQARGVGFTIADLRRLFAGLDAMASEAFDAETFIDEKIASLRTQIAHARTLIRQLQAAKRALAASP